MRRLCVVVAAVVMVIVGQFFAEKAFALAMGKKGNGPLFELNYTQ